MDMDKEIEELQNMLEDKKIANVVQEPVAELVEENTEEPQLQTINEKKKEKINFGDYEFVLCIKKTWFAIFLSSMLYVGLALIPILIALITR